MGSNPVVSTKQYKFCIQCNCWLSSKIEWRNHNSTHPHICRYCQREFETGRKLGGHVVCCIQNPNRHIRNQKLSDLGKLRKSSEATKRKISEHRKKYLAEHPEKVPYRLCHSSKESYIEKCFRKALEMHNISGYIQEFPMSIYSYDFAFPEQKLDVEIDGSTHLLEYVKEIDKCRDEYTKSQGWEVLRFSSYEIRHNINEVLITLRQKLKLI